MRVETPDLEPLAATMREPRAGARSVAGDGSALTARLGDASRSRTSPPRSCAAGVRLRGLNVDRPDLEDLFVSITGEGFDVLR